MNPRKTILESRNWKDFKAKLSRLEPKEKGDCFELLTKAFLETDPRYTTKLQYVWHHSKVPTKTRKQLNLPAQDEGIDLVAQSREGEYWAIQCKYKTVEDRSLTRKELSTFTDLTFNICNRFAVALACTTADRFSAKLKMHGERIQFLAGDIWRSLDETAFTRIHKHLSGATPPSPRRFKPRAHQQRAIRNAVKHFVKEKQRRGKMIMPCGTGKSLTGYWIAQKLEAKRVLVAVPSLSLIRQTLQIWAEQSLANQQDINWIVVCSDQSIDKASRTDAAVLTQDLGVRIHTDPKEIASWLRKSRKGMTVVFSTYQSGEAVAEASRTAQFIYDIGIMDEAHKTVGRRDSLFAHLLYERNIKIRKRVFMTATERMYRGQSNDVASMDDLELYGDTFELLSFKEALECDPPILSDYRIVTLFVSKKEVEDLISENVIVKPDKGKWNKELEADMLAALVALRKTIKKHKVKHAVSFHGTVARAEVFRKIQDVFTETFPESGKLDAFHVSGKTPTAVRAREIDEFAESKRAP